MARFPSLRTARELGKQHGLAGVVIVGVGGGKIGAVSYGSTKAQCAALVPIVDHLVDTIGMVELDASDFERMEVRGSAAGAGDG